MIRLFKRLTVSQTLLISHLLLSLIIISGMSIARYDSEWHRQVKFSAAIAKQSLQSHIPMFSSAVSGINYATMTLPANVATISEIDNALFVEVSGISDYSKTELQIRYLPSAQAVWRGDVSQDELIQSQLNLTRLQNQLAQVEANNTIKVRKLSYLLEKAQAQHSLLERSVTMQSQFSMTWQRPTHFDKHYVLDEQRFVMHIFLPLRNVNGGGVWAVFNAHELADFKATLMRDIALEALLALLLTMGVVYWVAHWIVNPLKNLAKSMTNPVNYRSLEVIPALERNDEIGQLAQAYQGLLLKIAQQLDSLRAKSDADSLTGLGSRYKYTRTASPYIQRHLSDGKVVALMICDIDNFKAYNDIYGHMQGDKALVQVAAQLEASLTNVDLAYRYGGEEFVVLCWRHNQEEIERVGELLRRAVESLSLIHSGNCDHNKVTVSIGGAMTQLDCKQKSEVNAELLTSDLFATADKALYECKAAGRNRTAWANVFSAQLTPIHSARGSK